VLCIAAIAAIATASPAWAVRERAPAVPRTSGSMYSLAVRLAGSTVNLFGTLPVSSRARLVNRASSMLLGRTGAKRPAIGAKTSLSATMGRAASTAVLLKAADAGTATDRAKALGTVLTAAQAEPHLGMAGLLFLNLAAREKSLAAADRARLGALRERVLPESPPYAELDLSKGWHESTTVHEEFWGDTQAAFRQNGFKLERLANGSVVARRTYPSGAHPPLDVSVTLEKGEVDLLRDENKARLVSLTYDGHSALGGNVSLSILSAPKASQRFRMACFFMCRGSQNIEELRRHLGDKAHVITTLDPSSQDADNAVRFALYDMLAARETYAFARRRAGTLSTRYLWPDSVKKLELVDADLDGIQDAAGRAPGTIDVLFNVGSRAGYRAARTDLAPHPPGKALHELDGDKLMRSVAFANTVLTYHAEESRNPVHSARKVKDRFVSAGWFEGPAAEVVRLVKRGGKVGIQVNALYSAQSRDALGALVLYELTRQIAPRGAKNRREQLLRPFLFASFYVHYMTPYQEVADEVLSTLAKRVGLPATLDYGKMERVIGADHDGYATDKHLAALEQALP
jgi:hypothetical protein